MNKKEDSLKQVQYKEALLKYAHAYNLKKNKSENSSDSIEKRYVIYARKSTEDEKRQVQSTEDQIEQCRKYAKSNNLLIVDEPIIEEKSAKIAGKRSQFNMMIERLYKSDLYNSILAWHPDRLARNMKESGEILDMLDNGIIVDLQFPSYSFNNDPAGKMTLSILFAMAKEFSDKLSVDTKRGNRKKVKDGKYIGTSKRGYYNNKNSFFRKDEDTFDLYVKAWKDYINGKPQTEIVAELKAKGEKITENTISNYFQDPFSAGIYCYGDQVVDISGVDKKFTPMITPKDFILAQKISKDNPKGWTLTEEFRPFRDLIYCKDCASLMTPGLSRSRSKERYLSITCSKKECKLKRHENGKTPIANTIRGREIMDFAINFYENLLKVDKQTYEKAKEVYMEERRYVVKDLKGQNSRLNSKLSGLKVRERNISDKFINGKNSELVSKKLSNDLEIVLGEIRQIESQIIKNTQQQSEYEFETESEFPDFESFMNLFKDVATTLQNTTNAYLIDQLVKLAFVNITIEDKKVHEYCIREPFKSFVNLKIQYGVANRI